MKFCIVFIILIAGRFSAQAQVDSSLCLPFRTGSFAYRDDSSNAVLITRTARTQEERIRRTGQVTRFKIRWISQCTYEIKQVWSNKKAQRKSNGTSTVVIINNPGKDRYEFTCACKGVEESKKKKGTVYRVPE